MIMPKEEDADIRFLTGFYGVFETASDRPVELDLGGHKWTVEDDGTVLRDGTTVFKGTVGGIQNLCLTDFNRDGVQDIVIVVLLNPSMDHDYAFVAIDTKGGRVIWDNDNYSIYGLNKRIRYEYGLLLISKMRLAVNRNGELVLLDHPVGKTETYEYKICYDSVTDKIKFVFVQEFDEEIRPDDVRVTG